MERIKAQAAKLGQLLSKPETFAAYKNVVTLTWDILKETGLLLWLVICLVLVVFEWFWKFSVGAGQGARNWVNSLEGSSDQLASETGKALLAAGKNSLDFTLTQAKSQLGFEIPEPKVERVEVKSEPVKAAPPVVAPPTVVPPKVEQE